LCISTGEIPDLGDMTLLETFNVSSNQLSGALPPSVGSLSELRHLDVSYNTGMRGDLPSSTTKLTNLIELNIQMTEIGQEVVGGGVAGKRRTILKKLPSLNKISM
jgi:Leucine-rich repeat (LRR) protein